MFVVLAVLALLPAVHARCCPDGHLFEPTSLSCQPFNTTVGEDSAFPVCNDEETVSVVLSSETPSGSHCVDETYDDQLPVLVRCRRPPAYRPVLRKCCPLGHVFTGPKTCSPELTTRITPTFYNHNITLNPNVSWLDFEVVIGDTCPNHDMYLANEFVNHSFLLVSGVLDVVNQSLVPAGGFCIEHILGEDRIFHFLCFPEEQASLYSRSVLTVAFIISSIALLATLVFHICWSKQHNLFAKTRICYILCLTVTYINLAVAQLYSRHDAFCVILGYMILYSALSGFCWLNVMAIDIWRTFRSIRARDIGSDATSAFVRYSAYAWGISTSLTGLTLLADMQPGLFPEHLVPHIGKDRCYFSKKTQARYLFYLSPVIIIITCNIVLYVLTAWRCFQVRAEINKMQANKDSVRTRKFTNTKDQFVLNIKLFLVMGVSWSMEVISYLAPSVIWDIPDLINALQGVIIFVIFGVKEQGFQRMSKRFRRPFKLMNRMNGSNCNERCNSDGRALSNSAGTTFVTTASVMSDSRV